MPINLIGMSRTQLEAFFAEWGEPVFRARQVLKWLHQQGECDFTAMTNLSMALRQRLQMGARATRLDVATQQQSRDGTRKWLFRLADGNQIETVYIPESQRGTLCVSSQVGCALDCQFCSTGKQGFSRDLTAAEIIGQLWHVRHQHPDCPVTNVVMMGMGEPLLNFDAVVAAMDLMLDDDAYGLSKYRVTLSTSGVVPAMARLAACSPVALAVSLHAPNDALRDQLVPLNRKYPLAELMQACRDYFPADDRRRRITFEYVMLDGINDQPVHARELAQLLRGVPTKINLIPFNPFPHANFQCSSWSRIESFRQHLVRAGYNTIIRKTRGDDIDAACGQLVGQVRDRTRRHARWQQHIARLAEA